MIAKLTQFEIFRNNILFLKMEYVLAYCVVGLVCEKINAFLHEEDEEYEIEERVVLKKRNIDPSDEEYMRDNDIYALEEEIRRNKYPDDYGIGGYSVGCLQDY